MIITNNQNMPVAFQRMAQGDEDYSFKDKRYSATTIIKPVREILLRRRHDKEIEQDCADMIWALFGKAVHMVLEQYGAREDNEWAEQKLEAKTANGYTVSGIIDYYNIDTGTIVDYKTCSVYKFTGKSTEFKDWLAQGQIYAWLLWKNGLPAKRVEFWGVMKDHSKRDARTKRGAGYPAFPVKQFSFNITDADLAATDEWVNAKMKEIEECEKLADEDLPLCPEEDRWHGEDVWAVVKEMGGRATKRFFGNTPEVKADAEAFAAAKKQMTEFRPALDKKCADYCLCCDFCPYYNEVVKPMKAKDEETQEN